MRDTELCIFPYLKPYLDVSRRLNNRIDLSYIPDHQLPHHYNVHRLIREEIGQQSVGYQQNTIPQQSFDTMIIQPNFQEYSDNNAYDVSSSIPQDAIHNNLSIL
ncbi:hypothetical protein C1646_758867 [Rhizophagus diaphanus]|nr:hypothetical protein C1646_758867 [Rhizophagus diaphanus] [Rhizophagus sp. MUCL 43196]